MMKAVSAIIDTDTVKAIRIVGVKIGGNSMQ